MHLDDRLPDLVDITDCNRQQCRRVALRQTPCPKCRQPLVPHDLCFGDGLDMHRSCAEMWNYRLIEGFKSLMEQDAEAEGDGWIPPSLSL